MVNFLVTTTDSYPKNTRFASAKRSKGERGALIDFQMDITLILDFPLIAQITVLYALLTGCNHLDCVLRCFFLRANNKTAPADWSVLLVVSVESRLPNCEVYFEILLAKRSPNGVWRTAGVSTVANETHDEVSCEIQKVSTSSNNKASLQQQFDNANDFH